MLNSSKNIPQKRVVEQFALILRPHMVALTLCCPKLPIYTPNCLSPLGRKCKFFFYCKIRRERSLLVAQKMSCGHFYIKKGSVVVSAPRLSFSEKLQKSVKILHFSHFGDNFQQIYNCSSMCLITAASLSSKFKIDISC